MTPSRTYVLVPSERTRGGATVDIVTQQWASDRRWVVGGRESNGVTVFRHRTFDSLKEVCFSMGLKVDDVRKRVLKAA